jgi:hypothetical protein
LNTTAAGLGKRRRWLDSIGLPRGCLNQQMGSHPLRSLDTRHTM